MVLRSCWVRTGAASADPNIPDEHCHLVLDPSFAARSRAAVAPGWKRGGAGSDEALQASEGSNCLLRVDVLLVGSRREALRQLQMVSTFLTFIFSTLRSSRSVLSSLQHRTSPEALNLKKNQSGSLLTREIPRTSH